MADDDLPSCGSCLYHNDNCLYLRWICCRAHRARDLFLHSAESVPELGWMEIIALGWAAFSIATAVVLARRSLPFDILEIHGIARWYCVFLISISLALVVFEIPLLVLYGVGGAIEANRAGAEVVSREYGPGLSRGPGYALMSIFLFGLGLAAAIGLVLILPRLIVLTILERFRNQYTRVNNVDVVEDRLRSSTPADWERLTKSYRDSSAQRQETIKMLLILDLFAQRKAPSEIRQKRDLLNSSA